MTLKDGKRVAVGQKVKYQGHECEVAEIHDKRESVTFRLVAPGYGTWASHAEVDVVEPWLSPGPSAEAEGLIAAPPSQSRPAAAGRAAGRGVSAAEKGEPVETGELKTPGL